MSLHVTNDTVELACRNADGAERPRALPRAARHAGRPRLDRRPGERRRHGAVGARHARARPARTAARGPGRVARRLAPADRPRSAARSRSRRYEIALDVDKVVALRLPGGDSVLQVAPGGQIKLANGAIGFNGISFNVKDERTRRTRRAPRRRHHRPRRHHAGALGRADRRRDHRQDAAGDRADAVSQASGLATIDGALSLSGNGPLPLVRGTISFAPVSDRAPSDRADRADRVHPARRAPRALAVARARSTSTRAPTAATARTRSTSTTSRWPRRSTAKASSRTCASMRGSATARRSTRTCRSTPMRSRSACPARSI